jgi:hypothetical protein
MEISKKRLMSIITEEIIALGGLDEQQDTDVRAMASQLASMDEEKFSALMSAVQEFREKQASIPS